MDPEKLKTVIASSHLHMPVRPTLLHRMALVSFLLFRFVKIWATCENFLGKCFTAPPPWQKIARTPMRTIYLASGKLGRCVLITYYQELFTTTNNHAAITKLYDLQKVLRPSFADKRLARALERIIIKTRNHPAEHS